MQVDEVLADLWAESAELDRLVGGLAADEWSRPTPAEGWTIAHQIAHLAWTDEAARLAIAEPDGFAELLQQGATNPTGYVDDAAAEGAALPPDQLLVYWRESRADLAEVLKAVPAGEKLPWFGPPMSATSMATARLMETWAHGQDVADALGVRRLPSNRLRHVAHLAVRTRGFSYLLRGRTAPETEIRVELTGPDGDVWSWGPEDAAQRVSGPAVDFCLLATQRRHRDDLAVIAEGVDADEWLDIAQAFAGTPGKGREPGQFANGSDEGRGSGAGDESGEGRESGETT